MAKTSPPQMYDHLLEPIKGWFHMGALDKDLVPADPTDARLIPGRVCYLDNTAKAEVGLAAGAMPLFLWPGKGDYDVFRDAGGIGGEKLMGLVASGGYEFQSTEFADDDYLPNDPLTAENNDALTTKGQLKKGAFFTDTICGVVSDGALVNENGKNVIQFWSYFLPPTP